MPDEWIFKAFNYCKQRGVGFLCAAFDSESVDFLSDKLRCKTIKSPSSEINNKDLLMQMSRKFNSIIVSTGASTINECLDAKKWLKSSKKKNELLFMHCVSEYPAPLEDSNLNAIKLMKKKLQLPIGLSDHTDDILVPIISVQNGCVLIEKHFTLSRKMRGPDHKASIEPSELKKLSACLKNYNKILGDGVKKPQKSELKNKNLIRKSAVCSRKILKKGTLIKNDDINFKRPFFPGSISPEDYKKIIGKKINRNLFYDKPFFISYFK